MPGNPLAHGQFVRYLRMCTEQEPVVVFSVVIGAIGAPRTLAPRRPSHQNLQLSGPCRAPLPSSTWESPTHVPTPDLSCSEPHSSLASRDAGCLMPFVSFNPTGRSTEEDKSSCVRKSQLASVAGPRPSFSPA